MNPCRNGCLIYGKGTAVEQWGEQSVQIENMHNSQLQGTDPTKCKYTFTRRHIKNARSSITHKCPKL